MDGPDDMGEHDGDDDDVPYIHTYILMMILHTLMMILHTLILRVLRHILAQPIWWTGQEENDEDDDALTQYLMVV